MASDVCEQCTSMQQSLEAILAAARQLLAAAPQNADRSGAAKGSAFVGVKGVASKLEGEVASLSARCKQLVEAMQGS